MAYSKTNSSCIGFPWIAMAVTLIVWSKSKIKYWLLSECEAVHDSSPNIFLFSCQDKIIAKQKQKKKTKKELKIAATKANKNILKKYKITQSFIHAIWKTYTSTMNDSIFLKNECEHNEWLDMFQKLSLQKSSFKGLFYFVIYYLNLGKKDRI